MRSSMTTPGLPTSICTTTRSRHRLRLSSARHRWFNEREIMVRRLMTDNAFSCVKNRSLLELLELLEQRQIKQLRTRA